MRQLGFTYSDMEMQDGRCVAVVEAKCRYRAPAHYDEEIVVHTRLRNVKESLIHFGYELRRAQDDTLIAEGETTHIVTDLNMKVAALPGKYLEAFRAAARKSSSSTVATPSAETGK
jgi:acyl-CoA thioester hydrolase